MVARFPARSWRRWSMAGMRQRPDFSTPPVHMNRRLLSASRPAPSVIGPRPTTKWRPARDSAAGGVLLWDGHLDGDQEGDDQDQRSATPAGTTGRRRSQRIHWVPLP